MDENPLDCRSKSPFVSKRPRAAIEKVAAPKVAKDALRERQIEMFDKQEQLIEIKLELYGAKLKIIMKDRPDIFEETEQ